jgi:hypothetical protein
MPVVMFFYSKPHISIRLSYILYIYYIYNIKYIKINLALPNYLSHLECTILSADVALLQIECINPYSMYVIPTSTDAYN